MKPKPFNSQENNQKKNSMDVDENDVEPGTSDSVKIEVDEDNVNVDNKTRDLEIESM